MINSYHCLVWKTSLLFFIVAVLYSSVGFGGGSSYLAILSLLSLPFMTLRTTALLCNVLVVSQNIFVNRTRFNALLKHYYPLVLISIPMAFLGGMIHLEKSSYLGLLGGTLVSTAVLMIIQLKTKKPAPLKPLSRVYFLIIGSGIGFLSGLVGIGGGIFLSPIFFLGNFEEASRIRVIASFFILVNSLSGLLGLWISKQFVFDVEILLPLLGAVFIGGIAGNLLGSNRFHPQLIKGITALLILYAGLKVLFT